MDTAKPTMVRVYLDPEDAELADKLASRLDAEQTWVVKRLLRAALRAVAAKGVDHATLPIEFRLETGRKAAA